jgi:hypothetical protein
MVRHAMRCFCAENHISVEGGVDSSKSNAASARGGGARMIACTVKSIWRDELRQPTCWPDGTEGSLGPLPVREANVTLRCVLDGLLLPAELRAGVPPLLAYDGDESFLLEAVEALYYELVEATDDERRLLQRYYRLLKVAADYRRVAA